MTALDLNKMQRNVLSIIRDNPATANDDVMLVCAYWRKFCQWDDRLGLEENMQFATRSESITRRRRELATLGLITYSEDATERREEAFKNEREYAAGEAVPWL